MKKMNVQRRTYEFLKFDESHRDVGNRLRKTFKERTTQAAANVREAKRAEQDAPNNPQLLKFDGDSRVPQTLDNLESVKKASTDRKGLLHERRMRWMNKSLKSEQFGN